MNGGDPVEPGVNERATIESQLLRVRTASVTWRSGGLSSEADSHPDPGTLAMHKLNREDNRVPWAIVPLRSSRAAWKLFVADWYCFLFTWHWPILW